MNIQITRHRHSRFGVDGTLSINGQYVCDTCEHPTQYITPGSYLVWIAYNVGLRRKAPYLLPSHADVPPTMGELKMSPLIRIGNGPFRLHRGSLLIGKTHQTGVILQSADTFARLIDRLDKAQNRGDLITVTIR